MQSPPPPPPNLHLPHPDHGGLRDPEAGLRASLASGQKHPRARVPRSHLGKLGTALALLTPKTLLRKGEKRGPLGTGFLKLAGAFSAKLPRLRLLFGDSTLPGRA